MNKALVWLGVLAVIIIVVVVLAARGDGDEKGGRKAANVVGNPALDPEQARGNTTYDLISSRLAGVEPAGMMYALRDLDLQVVTGSGTVVSVEEEQNGGWYVELDVDPEAADGTEVSVEVPPAKAKGQTLPIVGEECRYKGIIDRAGSGAEGLILELSEGLVGK